MKKKEDFRVRVALVIIKDDNILLIQHKKNKKKYWVLPGGGLDYCETIEKAAVRELKEELNISVKVGKLIFIVESISNDRSRHILNLIYTGRIIKGRIKLADEPRLNDVKFMPIDKIDKIKLYPVIGNYLKKAYKNNFNSGVKTLTPEWI